MAPGKFEASRTQATDNSENFPSRRAGAPGSAMDGRRVIVFRFARWALFLGVGSEKFADKRA